MNIFRLIFDWSEVWSLLIPIFFFFQKRTTKGYLKPIVIYVFSAFVINLLADIIGEPKLRFLFPTYLHTNTYLYNTHSIIRFICFSTFFIRLNQPFLSLLKKIIALISLLFAIIYFNFEKFNNPKHISADFLAVEAFLLLIYCLMYYLYKLNSDTDKPLNGPDFYIVTGLSIYVVVNFFVFLFYIPMINSDIRLANNMWDIHNGAYLTLSLFIAKAFSISDAA